MQFIETDLFYYVNLCVKELFYKFINILNEKTKKN